MTDIFSITKGKGKDIIEAVHKGKDTLAFFVAPNNRCYVASQIDRPFLYVVSDWVEGKKVYSRLREYSNKNFALMPEKEDVLIKRKTCNYDLLQERIKVLADMIKGRLDGVVITCESLLSFYPSAELFKQHLIDLSINREYDVDALVDALVNVGYKRVDLVEDVATFSLRGDVLDVYPVQSDVPYRISFFGEEIEKITAFSLETRVQSFETDGIEILPATDIIIPQNKINGILNSIRKAKRNMGRELAEVMESIAFDFENNPYSPLNTLAIPYLRDCLDTIYSFLPNNGVVILDDARQIEDKLRLSRKAFENRVDTLYEGKKLAVGHYESIPSYVEISSYNATTLGFARITGRITFFAPQEIFNLKTSPLPPYYNDVEGFFVTVKQMVFRGNKIYVYASDESAKNALIKAFNEHDIGVGNSFDSDEEICVDVGGVKYGFYAPDEKKLVIGINDLTRKTYSVKSVERKRAVFELPEKGDYVVHEKHGIGISDGMQRVATTSGERDFYVVLYKDGDKLYLPCEQLNTIEKYNGADKPTLHKLGGAEFERVKQRVKNSVKEMAFDLLEVYRSRYLKKGHVYQADTPWQKELENSFEFTETEDQIIAINEIKRDMESGKIMDRLLCGDVGFGKTEVAIRAIFKTVIEGKQAVVLAPTTILAQQHYNLIRARMNEFKLKIELLSRFVSNEEIKKSLARIKSGESNIIVATHRILSKDVVFHDLGLLVLDEEQRFGVEHKEKLKSYRNKVNVLSLSATPIPRTLHMALSGIRDISTLETPPKNRLPVETYVTEYSDETLVDAVKKELLRGGQTFILYNRVAGIESFYKHVKQILPEGTEVVYAHGQMDENALEDAVKRFYDGEAQVLVSTTIIENGVDLPNANTLFVIDADNLGLSQLYQLRGRVGRSDVLAYAYFTVKEGKVLTSNAIKRLDALMSNTELGSGFKIAMRDLEIRGAGNVLGREQHGQMEKVGYEMYLRLIKEGIEEMQGKKVVEKKEPELKIDGNYLINDEYIIDTKARFSVYKTVSLIKNSQEGQEYYKKIKETYGESEELKNIIRIGILKNLAKECGIERVVIGNNGVGLYYGDSSVLNEEGLFTALEKYRQQAVLTPSNPPMVVFGLNNYSQRKRIKVVKDFLEISLANKENVL